VVISRGRDGEMARAIAWKGEKDLESLNPLSRLWRICDQLRVEHSTPIILALSRARARAHARVLHVRVPLINSSNERNCVRRQILLDVVLSHPAALLQSVRF
jgi:hypothetical protein